jgi:hypothetical protein
MIREKRDIVLKHEKHPAMPDEKTMLPEAATSR